MGTQFVIASLPLTVSQQNFREIKAKNGRNRLGKYQRKITL